MRGNVTEPEAVDLSAIFSGDTIELIPPRTGKLQVLQQLVGALARMGKVSRESVEPLTEALMERERLGTTGMGKGLALPHLRSPLVNGYVGVVGVAREGIDFESLDGEPTRLVILLLSPFESREGHARIMGRLATLLSDKTLQYSLQVSRTVEALRTLLRFTG
jgi:mannitol/fructose-specific phosphotransferase system IIA component (Ntr-type)